MGVPSGHEQLTQQYVNAIIRCIISGGVNDDFIMALLAILPPMQYCRS